MLAPAGAVAAAAADAAAVAADGCIPPAFLAAVSAWPPRPASAEDLPCRGGGSGFPLPKAWIQPSIC